MGEGRVGETFTAGSSLALGSVVGCAQRSTRTRAKTNTAESKRSVHQLASESIAALP